MRWSGTNPTSPAPRSIRTPAPATNRQSAAAAPLGSREQFRSRDMQQRSAAPAQHGAKEYDPTKDDENDDDRYPLFSREEDENEDGKKDGDGDGDDNGNNGTGKDDSDDKDQKMSKKAA